MENTNLTIRDIAIMTEWKSVKRSFKYYYSKYSKMLPILEVIFEDIKNYKKRKQKEPDEEIELKVGGIISDPEDRFYCMNTTKYSLSFRKWRELANIRIQEETLRRYEFQEILAHFLWEITFYGFDEKEISKKAKSVFRNFYKAVEQENKKI